MTHLNIGILNLMPTLEVTEKQLLKVLDSPIFDIKVDFIYLENFTKDTQKLKYLKENYLPFKSIKDKYYDGIIITGAPLEHFCYSDILYLKELNEFLDYTTTHANSTLFICWASLYALDYFYNIPKCNLHTKTFGLFNHYVVNETNITKGLNEYFILPHSRYSTVLEEDILKNNDLILVSKSNEAGVCLVESKNHKQLFITGHAEYDKDTLELEYLRDLKLKMNIKEPVNYYIDNHINYCWCSNAYIIYHNWLYYYVLNYKV